MGKEKRSLGVALRSYVAEYNNDFTTDGSVLFCKVCDVPVAATKKFQVDQHVKTVKHTKLKSVKNTAPQQTLLSAASFKSGPKLSEFNKNLCSAFVSAGIPLYKLRNEKLKEFLEHYTKQIVPDESTLRKNYVPVMYQQSLEEIRAKIGENYIWVALDETTDVCGRYVANFVVGVLAAEEDQCHSYLLTLDVLPKVNHSTVAVFFNDALSLLWPSGIKYNKVLLACTDAAPYMVKAMEGLKILYSKMIHVTCLAHGLHRVAETIRSENPDVNELISVVKKIFVKAPSRIATFQEKAPNIPLPPEPVVTRWGTWLTAAEYYADHFEIVKTVIDSLDPSEAKAVETAQEILKKKRIREKLVFIKTHFMSIPPAIEKLEKRGVLLSENLKVVQSVVDKIKTVPKAAAMVKEKLSSVLQKNSGFKELQDICCILNDDNKKSNNSVIENYDVKEIVKFKFAQIASCDVERIFSEYKYILNERRQGFLFENLKQILVIKCLN